MHVQLERCGASLAARAAVIGGGGAGGGLHSGGGGRRGGGAAGGAGGSSSGGGSFNGALTPLREEELVSAGAQVASALAHLHSRGIAHMDVKPDNIFCALAADGCSVEMLGGGGGGGSEKMKKNNSNGDDENENDVFNTTNNNNAEAAASWDPDGLDEDYDGDASGATVAVKLGDFGLATPMGASSSSSSSAVALSPDEGDCRYLAPELLESSSASSSSSSSSKGPLDLAAADAFALGASLSSSRRARRSPLAAPCGTTCATGGWLCFRRPLLPSRGCCAPSCTRTLAGGPRWRRR